MIMATLLLAALTINYVTSTPDCNYAGVGGFNYPINACVRRTAGSFKYICKQGGVKKVSYDGAADCSGVASNLADEPNLDGFKCDAGQCTYTEECELNGCAADCSDCAANPDNFDRVCLPFIEGCGGSPGFLQKITCANGVKSQDIYFANTCDGTPDFGFPPTTNGDCVPDTDGIEYFEVTCNLKAPPSPKGKGKGKGQGKGKGSAAVASDIVMDHNNNVNNNNKEYYNLFGFEASLMDLILISCNVVFVTLCLCLVVRRMMNGKSKYTRASDQDYSDDQESKSFF